MYICESLEDSEYLENYAWEWIMSVISQEKRLISDTIESISMGSVNTDSEFRIFV